MSNCPRRGGKGYGLSAEIIEKRLYRIDAWEHLFVERGHPMKQRIVLGLVGVLVALAIAGRASAATIVEVTGGTDTSTFYPGQSVTTPGSGPYDNLTFNWFNSLNAPAAYGTLFLLSQTYTGTPAALNTFTPGYMAQATAAGNLYTFASGVTLQSSTQYFFFANGQGDISGYSTNVYSGGNMSFGDNTGFYPDVGSDANFRLSGVAAIPEPEAYAMMLAGLGLMGFVARRRKHRDANDASPRLGRV